MTRHPPAVLPGAGERLGPRDVGVTRVSRESLIPGVLAPGPALLGADLFHCCLLAEPPCVWLYKGRYEPTRRWASLEGGPAGVIFRSRHAGTKVPPTRSGLVLVRRRWATRSGRCRG